MATLIAARSTVNAGGAWSAKIPALDGIRGVAILWVVLHNCMARELAPVHGAWHALNALGGTGWIGVELFFALSGFLITAGLLDTQRTPHYFGNFYAQRALRILPLYYTVLLILLVILPRFIAKAVITRSRSPSSGSSVFSTGPDATVRSLSRCWRVCSQFRRWYTR